MPPAKKSLGKFVPPLSTAEKVSQFLETRIIQNELHPGTRLIERDLSASLGVSRIPIREALRRLEQAGLVKIIPRKGAQVTAITRKEVEEIYALRAPLSGLAARLAARNIREKDLRRLMQIGRQMAEKARRNDLKSYFPLNLKFHDLLRQAAGNLRLYQILQNLGKQTTRFRFTSLSLPGRVSRSNTYHQQLIRALKKRDEKKAERIARRIIREAGRALVRHFTHQPAAEESRGENSDPRRVGSAGTC